jgi:hypothetical protein
MVAIVALIPLIAMSGASAAAGGQSAFKAVTHASMHPDTCICGSPVTSLNGPVWAYDNLSRQFTVVNNGDGTYDLTIVDHGSFTAFAEPNNPSSLTTYFPIEATGSIDGTISYVVTSSSGPVGLPSQVPGSLSTGDTILLLFGGNGSITGGGDYTYTYKAGGDTYVQNTSGITGDITGHVQA